jgi:predicted anti-sigma-YlaC factor YlaD
VNIPRLLTITLVVAVTTGCSIKQIALNAVADELSGGTGGTFSQDEDLQFVGESLPFALKLMEGINGAVPKHEGMKLTLASGFVQYGVVFVEWPAEQLKYDDFSAYRLGQKRAGGFYRRAANYALDGLDLRSKDFRSNLRNDQQGTLAAMTAGEVPFLFWLGAGWISQASTNLEDPEMFGLFALGAQIMKRAYELDPDWNDGSIHEIMISLEPALPMPGGAERSKEHYDKARVLQGDRKAGPHVSYATAVALKAQDKDLFLELLDKALAVDLDLHPDDRLANDYAQQKARFLLEHLDDLFF